MSSTTLIPPTGRWPAPQWLALFYDLAFAAGVIAISGSYAYDHTLQGVLWFATTYGILASTWLLTGGATGGFTGEHRPVTRGIVVLTVIQMALVMMLSLASGDSIASSSGVFDAVLGLMLATVLALGLLARGSGHAVPGRSMALVAAAMVVLGLAWLPPDPIGFVLWLASLAMLGVAAAGVAVGTTVDLHRLAHRLGELTIIIVGEILVKVTLTLGDESLWSVRTWALGPLLLLLVGTWWAYFTGPVLVTSLNARSRIVWITAHWTLHVALLALAVGLSKLLVGSEALTDPSSATALLTGPAVVLVGSLAALDWVTNGDRARNLAVATGAVAVLAVVVLAVPLNPTVIGYAVALVMLAAVALPPRPTRRSQQFDGQLRPQR